MMREAGPARTTVTRWLVSRLVLVVELQFRKISSEECFEVVLRSLLYTVRGVIPSNRAAADWLPPV